MKDWLNGVQGFHPCTPQITQAEQQRESLIREIQTLEDRQQHTKQEQNHCEAIVQAVSTSAIEAFEKRMTAKLIPIQYEVAPNFARPAWGAGKIWCNFI